MTRIGNLGAALLIKRFKCHVLTKTSPARKQTPDGLEASVDHND